MLKYLELCIVAGLLHQCQVLLPPRPRLYTWAFVSCQLTTTLVPSWAAVQVGICFSPIHASISILIMSRVLNAQISRTLNCCRTPSSKPSPSAPTSKTIYVGIRVKPVDDHIGSIVGRSNSVALWSSVSLLYVNFVAYNLNSVALGGFIIRCRVTFR